MVSRNAAIAVVSNPVTGEEESKALEALLRDRGLDAKWIDTTEDDPGTGQARSAVDQGADIVVACGGDGTVRACIEALVGTDTALAIVPAGTGNLLAKNLGIPEDPADAFEVALAGYTTRIDVGFANGEAFAVMAGAGLDAVVMKDTPRESKERFGSLAYVKTALQHLRDDQTRAVAVADGGPVFSGKISTVLAANFGQLQGGIDLAPEADPADGRLEFVAVRASSITEWLRTGMAVLTKQDAVESLQRFSGPEATITFASPTPYELDGDERPATTHLAFSVSQRSLVVCVPEVKE